MASEVIFVPHFLTFQLMFLENIWARVVFYQTDVKAALGQIDTHNIAYRHLIN